MLKHEQPNAILAHYLELTGCAEDPGLLWGAAADALQALTKAEEIRFFLLRENDADSPWKQIYPCCDTEMISSMDLQTDERNRRLMLVCDGEILGTVVAMGCACDILPQALDTAQELCDVLARQIVPWLRKARCARQAAVLHKDAASLLGESFKTPLMLAMSSVEVLREKLKKQDAPLYEKEYAPYFSYFEKGMYRTLSLIQDLLQIDVLEEKMAQPPAEYLNLDAAVREIADAVRPYAESRGVALSYRMTSREPIGVFCARSYLDCIVLKMLSNGVRFCARKDGKVEAEVLLREGHAAVCVRDNGLGLSSEEMAHVFEKFWVGDTPPAHGEAGAGLGLYLARRMAQTFGAQLLVKKLPCGTEFCLLIPLKIPECRQEKNLSSMALSYRADELGIAVRTEFSDFSATEK